MNLRSLPQRQSFMEENVCFEYSGITAALFILSFWIVIIHTITIYTFNSSNVYMKVFYEKDLNRGNVMFLQTCKTL